MVGDFVDHYRVLGVDRSASLDSIKNAYRSLALKYHPDKYKGNVEFSRENMRRINEAYDVLGDEVKRRQFDGKVFQPDLLHLHHQFYSEVMERFSSPNNHDRLHSDRPSEKRARHSQGNPFLLYPTETM